MNLDQRIEAFARLGKLLKTDQSRILNEVAPLAANENPWFTKENVFLAMQGLEVMLQEDRLRDWIKQYEPPKAIRSVGVAFAGNIPLVGFHDLLCVLMSGHRLIGKLSSKDSVLMKYFSNTLIEADPGFSDLIIWADQLKGVEAVIATGSDNTARYFEYYFRKIPHIIRQNRTSCAIIQGDESSQDWVALGRDVFSYFGMGCRNVSKLIVPQGFDPALLADAWRPYESIANHHKYVNNLDYQKSLLLINRIPFVDGGFFLLKEDNQLVSPVSVTFYERYDSVGSLAGKLAAMQDKLQVVVSANGWYEGSIPFGTAQLPEVDDYADGVDTMRFLSRI